MNIRTAICASVLFVACVASVSAVADEAKCRVMDPTGTPLNIRTVPNGRIIGNLPNDMIVTVIDHAADRSGKTWVYISRYSDGGPIGWVYKTFIACAD